MSIDAGDIHLVDVHAETRKRALVLSGPGFHRHIDRVLVAVEGVGLDADDPFVIEVDRSQFAVHHMTTVPADRVLERLGRASAPTMRAAQRAVVAMLS